MGQASLRKLLCLYDLIALWIYPIKVLFLKIQIGCTFDDLVKIIRISGKNPGITQTF